MPIHATPARRKEIRLVRMVPCSTGRIVLPMTLRQIYELAPTEKTQARLAGRWQLRPLLQLSNYKYKAVVDVISFRVTSHVPMNPKNLYFRIAAQGVANSGVTPIFSKSATGRMSTTFALRIDDPTPEQLAVAITKINATPGLATDGVLQLLEVSVDVYPHDHSTEAPRLLMSDLLRRHFLPQEWMWRYKSGWPRWVGAEKRSGTVFGKNISEDAFANHIYHVEKHREVPVNTTFYVGARDAGPLMVRVMDKVIDEQKRHGTFTALDPAKQRSRIEVELRRSALDRLRLNTIDDLRGFNFCKLRAQLFDFAIPTLPFAHGSGLATQISRVRRDSETSVFEKSGVLGVTYMQKAGLNHRNRARAMRGAAGLTAMPPNRNGLGKNGFSIDFVDLNRAVDGALALLTRRWKKPVR